MSPVRVGRFGPPNRSIPQICQQSCYIHCHQFRKCLKYWPGFKTLDFLLLEGYTVILAILLFWKVRRLCFKRDHVFLSRFFWNVRSLLVIFGRYAVGREIFQSYTASGHHQTISNPPPLELKHNNRSHDPILLSNFHLNCIWPTQLEHVHGHSYTLPCSSVNANYYGNVQVAAWKGG